MLLSFNFALSPRSLSAIPCSYMFSIKTHHTRQRPETFLEALTDLSRFDLCSVTVWSHSPQRSDTKEHSTATRQMMHPRQVVLWYCNCLKTLFQTNLLQPGFPKFKNLLLLPLLVDKHRTAVLRHHFLQLYLIRRSPLCTEWRQVFSPTLCHYHREIRIHTFLPSPQRKFATYFLAPLFVLFAVTPSCSVCLDLRSISRPSFSNCSQSQTKPETDSF